MKSFLSNHMGQLYQPNRIFSTSWNRKNVKSPLNSSNNLHVTSKTSYPVAAALQIPDNIDAAETTRFSPMRSRDISANAILSHQSNIANYQSKFDITMDASSDPHVESYDCNGSVSLNSSMQSNVPSPLGGMHKFTHLNMPGGQWSQEGKFMSDNLHKSHYTNLRNEVRAAWSQYDENATVKNTEKQGRTSQLLAVLSSLNNHNRIGKHTHAWTNSNCIFCQRSYSTNVGSDKKSNLETAKSSSETISEAAETVPPAQLSKKEQLKRAFKEYGSTIIIFHVGISLISLGGFYFTVSRGVDMMPVIDYLGLGSTSLSNKIAAGASSFVAAYAIHKIFAPVRISITLGATPFIVRYLRAKGFLKVKQK